MLRLNLAFKSCIFFLRNYFRIRGIENFQKKEINLVFYRGYRRADAAQVSKIIDDLNNGARFSGLKKWLYALTGGRSILVATCKNKSGDEVIVGVNIYYFNLRDVVEKTIHEGFIGVIPNMCGQGIASTMRSIAKEHFGNAGLQGISTRISLSNVSSLQSAKKNGFCSVEEYSDCETGEIRNYMVVKLTGFDVE